MRPAGLPPRTTRKRPPDDEHESPRALASLLALALLAGPALAAEKKPTVGDISRAIAYADVMRAFAYSKQATEFKERFDKIGPGPDGLEAMTNAANS